LQTIVDDYFHLGPGFTTIEAARFLQTVFEEEAIPEKAKVFLQIKAISIYFHSFPSFPAAF